MPDAIVAVTRGLAYSMGCFVVNATGVVDDATIDAYEPGPEERAFLESVKGQGHASVIAPNGQVVAGPLKGGEGILYADADLNDVLVPKLMHDFNGHYNRFDIFSLQVNTQARPPVSFTDPDAAGAARDVHRFPRGDPGRTSMSNGLPRDG